VFIFAERYCTMLCGGKKQIMEKNQVKWRCELGCKGFDYWNIKTIKGDSIATTYADVNGVYAKQIVSDHNEQLKIKKALAKTRFAK